MAFPSSYRVQTEAPSEENEKEKLSKTSQDCGEKQADISSA